MSTSVKSTKAKVRDPQKVREILGAYEWRDINFELRQDGPGWTLRLTYDDPDSDSIGSPSALRIEQFPSLDVYPDEDTRRDAEADLYMEEGDEGFLSLLRELAEHLESPLLILYSWGSPCSDFDHGAEVWRVQPGARDVETLAA